MDSLLIFPYIIGTIALQQQTQCCIVIYIIDNVEAISNTEEGLAAWDQVIKSFATSLMSLLQSPEQHVGRIELCPSCYALKSTQFLK